MPYCWEGPEDGIAAPRVLHLWQHRSLPPQGFVLFIGITCLMFLVPLLAMVGHAELWGLLPFVLGAVALTWWLMRRNETDAAATGEVLTLTPERAHLVHRRARQPAQEWEINPFWMRITLVPEGGPVENYIVLKGAGREVQLGAFLSPDERVALKDELERALLRLGRRG